MTAETEPASLWQLSLRDALDRTASADPTPGGGSIAPMSGAYGLGLVMMALEVSAKKHPAAEITQAIAHGKRLLAELSAFVDRDVTVFNNYMAALRMPKQTSQEQTARAAARDAASLTAARTPLQAAEVCLRALQFAEASAPYVHKNIWSDLLAGADLVFGALKAVLRTVDINVPTLRDQRVRQQIAERAAIVEQEAAQTYSRVTAFDEGPAYA